MSAVWAVVVSGLFTLAVAVYNQRSKSKQDSKKVSVDERAQLTEEWDRIRRTLREENDRCITARLAAEERVDELEAAVHVKDEVIRDLRAERDHALAALEDTFRLGIEHRGSDDLEGDAG